MRYRFMEVRYEKSDGKIMCNGKKVTFESYTSQNHCGNYTFDRNYYDIEAIRHESGMPEEEAIALLERFIGECRQKFNEKTLDDWDPELWEVAPKKWIVKLSDGSVISTRYTIFNNKSWCNRGGLDMIRALGLPGHYVDCRLRGCGDITRPL